MKHPSADISLPKIERWQTAGFALYVHWPFCQAKCPYCDFNSHVATQIDQGRWTKAYISELRRASEETKGRTLRSIFFGGGTPSLMLPSTVEAIISEANRLWSFSNDIEITLEANPTSVEMNKFRDFKRSGINRVSVGVQALNDEDLRRLGRMHSAAEAISAVNAAQTIFERTSFDLIYARQHQTLAAWEAELDRALSMAGEHLSLYQLTIEAGTVFGARSAAGKLAGIPVEDTAVDMFAVTQDMCEAAGLPAYEVSNHARKNSESRHNSVYWRCGDYIGLGPGAHGRLTSEAGKRVATVASQTPGSWIEAVEAERGGESVREILSRSDQAAEFLLMGLRMSNGIDMGEYASIAGRPLNQATICHLVDMEHMLVEGSVLRTTRSGRMLLNAVIEKLTT